MSDAEILAEILESGHPAYRDSHQVIGHQEERANDRQDFRPVPHTGIDTASVGIVAADDHVIDAYQRGEQAHWGNEPKGTVTCHGGSQAANVDFARTPIAVE